MELIQIQKDRCNSITVRNGCYSYGSLRVLENLDMTVKKGTIYGLLGASGCGKTTLLSCIVGRRKLNKGDIRVLGVKPGTAGSEVPGKKIGYMPQETALYLDFTIKEMVRYYGWIYGMSSEQIETRLKELMDLVDIANPQQIVKHMSGGQKRRVSFAVALLHEPAVMILDEPTVGMDAVLKDIVWQHLLHITNSCRVAIIVTTHYIEEARKAHMIGLMRKGSLLDEDSPDALLQKYGCESLEGVFLQLSASQEDSKVTQVVSVEPNLGQNKTRSRTSALKTSSDMEDSGKFHLKKYCSLLSKGRMKALLFKNLICVFRDFACMTYQFGLCMLAVTSLYVGFGFDPTGLHLAVVNKDRSAPHPRCDGGRLETPPHGCNLTDLSCRYLAHIKEPLVVKDFYNSTLSATEAVRSGKAWGTVHFGENFTEALVGRLSADPLSKDHSYLNQSSVHVQLDMSNHIVGWALREEILAKYQEFAEKLVASCGYNQKLVNVPVRINEPIYGSRNPSFIDFVAPSILNVMIFFSGVTLSVWTITGERREGLLNRNIVAGVTTLEIMLSYFLALTLLMITQVVIVVALGMFVYHFECVGSLSVVVVLLLLQGINGMFYGFVLSACCEKDDTASFLSVGSLVPLLFLCGVIWPLEGMHVIMRFASKLAPLTLPIEGTRAVMRRGASLLSYDVYVGFLASVAWLLVLIATCIVVLRFKKL